MVQVVQFDFGGFDRAAGGQILTFADVCGGCHVPDFISYECACGCFQVEALVDDEVVEGPIFATIHVLDINNHAPYFNQSYYTALVRENTPAGVHSTSRPPPLIFETTIQPGKHCYVSFQVCRSLVCLRWIATTPALPTLN